MNARALGLALAVLAVGLVEAVPERPNASSPIVSAVPRWSKGDKLALTEEHSSTREEDGLPKPAMAASAPLDLEVLEVGPKGYVVRWMAGRPEIETNAAGRQPFLERLTEMTAGVGIELVLDTVGTPTGVRNATEVREKMEKLAEVLREELTRTGASASMIDGLLGQLRRTYTTEQAILDHVAKSASVYFLPLGWRFRHGESVEYEAEIPSPAGTAPLPSHGVLALDSYDQATGLARVTWTQRIDRERAGEAIRALVGSMLGKSESADVTAAIGAVDIEDRAEYVIDTRTGWVLDMSHERSVRLPGAERVDRARIRRRG